MIPTSNMICVYRYRKSCDGIREMGPIIITRDKRIILGIGIITLKFHQFSQLIRKTPIWGLIWIGIIVNHNPCLSIIFGGKNPFRKIIYVIKVARRSIVKWFSHFCHGYRINHPIVRIVCSNDVDIRSVICEFTKQAFISHECILVPRFLNDDFTWLGANEKLLGRLSK